MCRPYGGEGDTSEPGAAAVQASQGVICGTAPPLPGAPHLTRAQVSVMLPFYSSLPTDQLEGLKHERDVEVGLVKRSVKCRGAA
jgi:hypothetical protein